MSTLIGKAAVHFIQRFVSRLDVETMEQYVEEDFDLVRELREGNWQRHDWLRRRIITGLQRGKPHIAEWDVEKFLDEYLKQRNPALYAYFRGNGEGMKWLLRTRQAMLNFA